MISTNISNIEPMNFCSRPTCKFYNEIKVDYNLGSVWRDTNNDITICITCWHFMKSNNYVPKEEYANVVKENKLE